MGGGGEDPSSISQGLWLNRQWVLAMEISWVVLWHPHRLDCLLAVGCAVEAWTSAIGWSCGSCVPLFSHRCQGETQKTLALAQLWKGLWLWGFPSNVISPIPPDAFTESGISLNYRPFCACFILTPLYLALGMVHCKDILQENISALPHSPAPSQGVAGSQTSSMFPGLCLLL